MTSISDKSLQRERRRRPAPRPRRRTDAPWGLYAGFLVGLWAALYLAVKTRATWPLWLIAALVVVVVGWMLWEMWERRRGS